MGDDDGCGCIVLVFALIAGGAAIGTIKQNQKYTQGLVHQVQQKVNRLESTVEELRPKIHTENVIAGPEPEKFYEINGQRSYVEIDGKPVSEYFKE